MSDVPRRLKYKKNSEQFSQEKWKNEAEKAEVDKALPQNYKKFIQEHATSAGIKELHRFHQENNRLPQRHELEQMAESIYSQWKAKEEKNERYHHHGKDKGKNDQQKNEESLAQKRKSRREALVDKRKERTQQRQKHAQVKQEEKEDFKEPKETEEEFEEPQEEPSKGEDLSGLLEEDEEIGELEGKTDLQDEDSEDDTGLEFFEEEKPLEKKKKLLQK